MLVVTQVFRYCQYVNNDYLWCLTGMKWCDGVVDMTDGMVAKQCVKTVLFSWFRQLLIDINNRRYGYSVGDYRVCRAVAQHNRKSFRAFY